MKFPKLFKKAAALVMAAVTTFSVLPAATAFAAGDIGTISFDWCGIKKVDSLFSRIS